MASTRSTEPRPIRALARTKQVALAVSASRERHCRFRPWSTSRERERLPLHALDLDVQLVGPIARRLLLGGADPVHSGELDGGIRSQVDVIIEPLLRAPSQKTFFNFDQDCAIL